MGKNETQKWQDNAALKRFQMISPLLDETLDRDARIALRKEIAERENVSVKSLRRYEQSYAAGGFGALRPQDRHGHRASSLPANFDEVLNGAIQLKREVPTRSVEQIIFILEGEGLVPPGILKRSTLQRYLYNAGFGTKQMRRYAEGRKSSSKRFCMPHRMMLVQADIKYGPYLPIGKSRKPVRTYLSSIIDDHSRYILFSEFYDNQEALIVEDSFRNAILRCGKCDVAYVDNGKQYLSRQLQNTLTRLGIRMRHAPIRSGQSKGVIEKFHQVADDFIAEAKAKKIDTLKELNRYWKYFLEEYYQKRAHAGIAEYYKSMEVPIPEGGISPEQEWNRDSRPLVFLDASVVGEAFLHHETREVDKAGCISFQGRIYEVSVALIGAKVEIAYDPIRAETLMVTYQGMEPITAHPVRIGSHCDPKPPLPASMQPAEPETSRFLDVLEKKHEKTSRLRAQAISYASYGKETP